MEGCNGQRIVLILVLVEYAFRAEWVKEKFVVKGKVLILVLVEYAFRA